MAQTSVFSDNQEREIITPSLNRSGKPYVVRTVESTIRFKDINPLYTISSDNRLILTNEDAVKSQIRNILSTVPGSEEFEPEFGSELPFLLFEPINNVIAWRVENATITALKRWMNGVISLDRTNCSVSVGLDGQSYDVKIKYVIVTPAIGSYYHFNVRK